MDARAHIQGGHPRGAAIGDSDESIARNLGRMCGHIAAAIRTPVAPAAQFGAAHAARAVGHSGHDAGAAPCCGGAVVARRIERCDAPGPSGTTLRRTVVDEIVAPAPGITTQREHHAS